MIDDDRRMKVDENGGCYGWWDVVVWCGVEQKSRNIDEGWIAFW